MMGDESCDHELERLELEAENADLTTRLARAVDALRDCWDEANDAITGGGADEDETYCFGNLIHVQRICDAYRRTEGGDDGGP
jgi:hypothetical protein